ncbi:helix-turn-helix transcriptional regulator [Fructilactobacillus sanfranciscensis]|uniref:helix-turn-helix transcriptional regulator n=1 Tax=Fructilactobacillus sanfranciscensis TaxID=1625 RepID=UPI0031F80DA8
MIIFPSKSMLQKLSVIVKHRREDIHMSQTELAKGICTQATISTLENKGCFKSWESVPQIFERLNLDINDLENEFNYQYGDHKLKQIEKNLLIHNFSKAQKRLNQIKYENLDTKNLLARYECNSGFVDLFVNHNQDDSISNFNLAINKHQTRDNQIVIGWSYLGIALAYHDLNLRKQTKCYLKLAIKELHICFQKKHKVDEFRQTIRFAITLLAIIDNIDEPEICLIESNLVVKKLKQSHSFYCLRDFYNIIGDCLIKINQKEKAAEYFNQAEQLQGLYSYSNLEKLSLFFN